MKRADIKIDTEYAVKVRTNDRHYGAEVLRGIVEDVKDGKAYVRFPDQEVRWKHMTGARKIKRFDRPVTYAAVLSTWKDYKAAKAAEQAAADKRRAREVAAWEAKRAEERERFEQGILPAFKGLTTVNHVSGLSQSDTDLAAYIEDSMLRMGSSTVTLRETDLRGIAQRILELQAIVQQNALVAGDPPEAGHTPLTRMQVIEQELAKKLKED